METKEKEWGSMINGVEFWKLRSSAAVDNQAVLQLYCNKEIASCQDIEAFYTWNDEELKIEICSMADEIDADSRIRKCCADASHVLTVIIPVTDVMPDDLTLWITASLDGQNRTVLYTCSGTKLKSYIKKLNYEIESVTEEKGHLVVRGWAVDHDKVHFAITRTKNMEDVDVNYEIEWSERTDILQRFPEYEGDEAVGFCLTLKNKKVGMNLLLLTLSKFGRYRFRGITKFSRFDAVNKAKRYVHRGIFSLNQNGFAATVDKTKKRFIKSSTRQITNYSAWIEAHMPDARELEAQKNAATPKTPVFSAVILPEMKDGEFVKSLRQQTCTAWELRETDNICEAVLRARGDYIIFGRTDDILTPDALYECMQHINDEKPDVIYSDEDYFDRENNSFSKPDFKPDFNIDLLRSCNYIHHFLAVSKSLVMSLQASDVNRIYENEYDFIFRCIEKAKKICHIPKVLYRNVEKCSATAQRLVSAVDAVDTEQTVELAQDVNTEQAVELAQAVDTEQTAELAQAVDTAKTVKAENATDVAEAAKVENAAGSAQIANAVKADSSTKAANAENSMEYVQDIYSTNDKEMQCHKDMQAIEEHLERCEIEAEVIAGGADGIYEVTYPVKNNPLVSIIIPNKDHVSDLKRCMESIDNKSDYRNYEYIIVENNSEEQATFDYYREITERDNVHVVCWEDEFNYSSINNYGAEAANGEYLLLLNNDTQIINEDCISQMLGYCQREDVGVVGARLYYEDGTIQHGGVVIGLGGIAGHAFVGCEENDELYHARTQASCDYSAVTAACMMVKKSVFEAVGGLDEAFRVAFNDSDFCLKVRKMGKLVVYNANAKLYHYESKSRGSEDTHEKQERFQDEIELFYEKWKDILQQGDPYYNPNLTLDLNDFSCRR